MRTIPTDCEQIRAGSESSVLMVALPTGMPGSAAQNKDFVHTGSSTAPFSRS